jgi:NitT/TauT family transport system substrate-binding protein
MNTSRIVIAIFVIVAVVAGVYFGWVKGKGGRNAATIDPITVAAYAGDSGALVYVAQAEGLFEQNHLNVTIEGYEAGKLAADALIVGKADICTSAGFVFVSNCIDHRDLRIFGTIATAQLNKMIARKDKGIRSVRDLRGKKIGVTRKSVGEFFLGSFLIVNGLSLEEIKIVDLNPGEIVQAMLVGEIDAALTWEPNIYKLRQALGEGAIIWPGQAGQEFYFVLIAKDNWLKTNQQAARRFLKALIQAEAYLKAHREAFGKLLEETFKYTPAYVAHSLKNHKFTVGLPQSMLISLEDQARWRMETGLMQVNEFPNYLNYLDVTPLHQIAPKTVRIIR